MNWPIKFYLYIRHKIFKIDDRNSLQQALDNGMKLGKDPSIQDQVMLDPSHSWLISIGDKVTLAPRVCILAHDASTKRHLGYTLIAPVTIGNNVFIGAGTIVLPGSTIGDNVIIGAGSIVTGNIPSNNVYAGNPARQICTLEEYLLKRKEQMQRAPLYDESYIVSNITPDKKVQMISELSKNPSRGFIR